VVVVFAGSLLPRRGRLEQPDGVPASLIALSTVALVLVLLAALGSS
jgi:hypothetical protein